MKKSLINDYLKALSTLVNDNRISFSITGNFADKCHAVAYWCNKQILHDFTLFNDGSIVSYDNLVNDYLTIMAKHPTKQGDKQLFSLRYDNVGYCSLAVSYDVHNLEFFGTRHKRISGALADYLFNVLAFDDKCYVIDCCIRYKANYDFNQTILFSV